MFGGIRFIADDKLVDTTEDWSKVRSPSRAERRRKQGHRQNIRIVGTPRMTAYTLDQRTYYAHPAFIAHMNRELKAIKQETLDASLFKLSLP